MNRRRQLIRNERKHKFDEAEETTITNMPFKND